MQWRDVYHAACRELQRVESEFGKGDEYRAAVLKLNEMEDLRCGGCAGFGFSNKFYGHTATPDSTHSELCKKCNGTGFELDLGEVATRAAERVS